MTFCGLACLKSHEQGEEKLPIAEAVRKYKEGKSKNRKLDVLLQNILIVPAMIINAAITRPGLSPNIRRKLSATRL